MPQRISYAVAAAIVFLVEAGIAIFVHDRFVRPYLGDSLAVVLVYLTIRAATPLGIVSSTAAAVTIACAVEFGQWFGLVDALGLQNNAIARVAIGTGFDPRDFIAYAGGAVAVVLGETWRRGQRLP